MGHLLSKRRWLEERFDDVVREIKREGMLGLSLDELFQEAGELSCMIGQEAAKEARDYLFAKREIGASDDHSQTI